MSALMSSMMMLYIEFSLAIFALIMLFWIRDGIITATPRKMFISVALLSVAWPLAIVIVIVMFLMSIVSDMRKRDDTQDNRWE